MYFITLILKNIFRQRARSFITILGISIGVATIVSLGAIMNGAVFSAERMLRSGKADFSIIERGVSDFLYSKHVRKAAGVVIGLVSLRAKPYFLVLGVKKEDLSMVGISIIDGTAFSREKEVIVGEIAAKELNIGVGAKLSFSGEEFIVTGIFETGNPYFNSLVFISIYNTYNS